MIRSRSAKRLLFAVGLSFLAGSGCSVFDPEGARGQIPTSECLIEENLIFSGGPGKDGIPALTNPPLIPADEVTFLRSDDRVIGLLLNDQPIAVPHNILWHHEIVNLDLSGDKVAVTYCPLTGSGIVFDRASVNGATLGVSGLLYQSNLIMYDRSSDESLFSQMSRAGSCGPKAGSPLEVRPVMDMNWSGWQTLFPNSRVVSSNTGHRRNYGFFPYGSYESLQNTNLLFPVTRTDQRRPLKERVLGLPIGLGGIAFPFGALDSGPLNVTSTSYLGRPVVIFWERARSSATAFYGDGPAAGVQFSVQNNRFVDDNGNSWDLSGRATAGPRSGDRLEPVKEAYVAFWFAWAAFHPDTQLFIN